MRARTLCWICGHADMVGERGCGHLPIDLAIGDAVDVRTWYHQRMAQRARAEADEILQLQYGGERAAKRSLRAMISAATRAGRRFVAHRCPAP